MSEPLDAGDWALKLIAAKARINELEESGSRMQRAYEATLNAYAELVGLSAEDSDDEIVYENVRARLAEVERLRAELARRDEQIAKVTRERDALRLVAPSGEDS